MSENGAGVLKDTPDQLILKVYISPSTMNLALTFVPFAREPQ